MGEAPAGGVIRCAVASELLHLDGQVLPIPDTSVDLVISKSALEHVP